MKFDLRCYFIYRLVEGLSSSEEVAKSIKPKLIICTVLSVLYDLPRLYLNVNLFGSLCTFYYNIIQKSIDYITYRIMKGDRCCCCCCFGCYCYKMFVLAIVKKTHQTSP